VDLVVELYTKSLARDLEQDQKDVRFASALMLTRTAQDSQAEIKRQLPRRFEIRNRAVVDGIRIQAATKSKLVASVGSIDDFMALQEEGGTKQSRRGKSLAVPDTRRDLTRREPGSIRRTSRGSVTSGTSPQGMLKKAGPKPKRRASPGRGSARRRVWVVEFKDGRKAIVRTPTRNSKVPGKRLLRTKTGRLSKSPKKVLGREFRYVWTFSKSAKIKPRLGLLETTTRVIDRRLQVNWDQAFEEVFGTGRGGDGAA